MKDIRKNMDLIYGTRLISTKIKKLLSEKGQIGYCYKGVDNYEVIYSELSDKAAQDSVEIHEYGHIYLGHLDGQEYLRDSFRKLIDDKFDELVDKINEKCNIDFAEELLTRLRNDPMTEHMIHNIAMDCEVNTKILNDDDVEHLESVVNEEFKGITKMDFATKLVRPKVRWGFPEGLTYPDYLTLIIEDLDKFIKMMVVLKYGPQGSGSGQGQQGQGQQGQSGSGGESGQGQGSGSGNSRPGQGSGSGRDNWKPQGVPDGQGQGGSQSDESGANQQGGQSGQGSSQVSQSPESGQDQSGHESGSGQSGSEDQDQSEGAGGSGSQDQQSDQTDTNDSGIDNEPQKISKEAADLLNNQEYVDKRYKELLDKFKEDRDITDEVKNISSDEGGVSGSGGSGSTGGSSSSSGEDGESIPKGRKSDHGTPDREKVHLGEIYSSGSNGKGSGRSINTRSFEKNLSPLEMGLERVIRDFKKRVIKRDWRRNITYKYNRRIITDVISPSYTMKITSSFDPTILFILDVSGSMNTRLVDTIITTVRRKMRSINSNLKYSILTWDTDFCELYRDLNTGKQTPKISTGGGTELAKSFIYAKENFSNDTIIVVISDFCDDLCDWEVAMSKMKDYSIYGFNYGSPQDQKNFKVMKVENCRWDG